jgi:uncharacterized protein
MAADWRTLILTSTIALAPLAGCQPEAENDAGSSSSSSSRSGGLVYDASWEAPDNPLAQHEEWTDVTLGGETFAVALALDMATRTGGLSDVPNIPEDRGMLFVFPTRQRLQFVMRDCLVDIDIAYLTDSGSVGKMYTMTVDPREEGESDFAYERRLRRYDSAFPARMALELPAGTLDRLGVKIGDQVGFGDLDALKRMAR